MIRFLLFVGLVFTFTAQLGAQTSDNLPLAPAYKGEIRRAADGSLVTQPEVDVRPSVSYEAIPARASMVVGPNEKINTITEAAKLARDGEVIEIRPGDYRGQPAVWTQNNLLIRASGARPVMLADGKSAEGKAIWVVRGNNVRIDNIAFRGARVPSGNGAGIRFERGSLPVTRCTFFDNEMGILTANHSDMSLEVVDSEFGFAPHDANDLHHLLYVGAIGKFVLSGSRFQQAYLGHLVKSRARENLVRYNLLVDGSGGRASYELEFPNGGIAHVIGNVIGQSAGTDNPVIIAYGAEGQRWPENGLYLAHNTVINDANYGIFLKVWVERFAGGVDVWTINNLGVGYGEFTPPAQGRHEGNRSISRNELMMQGEIPMRLTGHSSLRGAVRLPGQVHGIDLMPTAEFNFPVGTRSIRASSQLAPGAFQ